LALPLLRLAAGSSEVTTLYRELRKPLLRYLVCLGLSSDEAQDVVQDAFLSLQRHLASVIENRKTSAAGCFALLTTKPGIARRATITDSLSRLTARWIFWQTTRRQSNGFSKRKRSGVSQPQSDC
jgi:hypothetical protein